MMVLNMQACAVRTSSSSHPIMRGRTIAYVSVLSLNHRPVVGWALVGRMVRVCVCLGEGGSEIVRYATCVNSALHKLSSSHGFTFQTVALTVCMLLSASSFFPSSFFCCCFRLFVPSKVGRHVCGLLFHNTLSCWLSPNHFGGDLWVCVCVCTWSHFPII